MSGYLIEYNRSTRDRLVTAFEGKDGPQRALAERLRRERERTDGEWEIVSLNSNSVETIMKTHSRYFSGHRLTNSVA
ncbi:hypothetical protein [Arthrobacter sp.]|uniref:hypothetical protein n=1 Tax=Arthrobacter sp. TaxID=1667 RepID=UPI003A8E4C56